MLYVVNAFSLNMLPEFAFKPGAETQLTIEPLSVSDDELPAIFKKLAAKFDGFTSGVGHTDIAGIITHTLRADIPAQRINVVLQPHDALLVAQYKGPRLQAGLTTLPEGAVIRWMLVTMAPPGH